MELLVTSETRKQLLRLLWQEGVEASAHQLSNLSGCSYASVYDELEQLVNVDLVLKTKSGKSNLYSRNLQSEFAESLCNLVGELRFQTNLKQLDEQEVEAHLFALGAPLGGARVTQKSLSLEEALVAGVMLAHKNSTVARVLPVVMAKNVSHFDFERLFFLARKEKVSRGLGFLLDLTGTLSSSRKLKKLALKLMDKRVKTRKPFFVLTSKKGKYALLLEEQNTPELAKKWHFSMNMGLDSFSSLYKKVIETE